MGTESAIVFTTGHQANVGTLGTLLGPGDTVIVDSGDHASILDGVLLSRAKLRPFRHNRMDKLEQHARARPGRRRRRAGRGRRRLLDGGRRRAAGGDLELCSRHGARLMVDEAHGAGVLGARGAGACELFGVEDRVDLRMGTFSKSLASCGGFVAGPHEVIDYLRISSRAFLFTASAVPAALGAALAALRVLRSRGRPPAARGACSTTPRTARGSVRARLRVSSGLPATPGSGRARASATPAGRGRAHADHPGRWWATTGRRRCCGAPSTTAGVFVEHARCTPPCRRAARCCARA